MTTRRSFLRIIGAAIVLPFAPLLDAARAMPITPKLPSPAWPHIVDGTLCVRTTHFESIDIGEGGIITRHCSRGVMHVPVEIQKAYGMDADACDSECMKASLKIPVGRKLDRWHATFDIFSRSMEFEVTHVPVY